jgi:hypothetical protein
VDLGYRTFFKSIDYTVVRIMEAGGVGIFTVVENT